MYRVISGIILAIQLCLSITQASAATNQPLANFQTENKLQHPILLAESDHDYEKTIEHVRRAIKGSNFLLIKEQNLDDGFNLKTSSSRQRIIYFCNFAKVNKAIKSDYRVGQFLPCRITVMEVEGKVFVSAINPKSIQQLLENQRLSKICDEMYDMYLALLNEATF